MTSTKHPKIYYEWLPLNNETQQLVRLLADLNRQFQPVDSVIPLMTVDEVGENINNKNTPVAR